MHLWQLMGIVSQDVYRWYSMVCGDNRGRLLILVSHENVCEDQGPAMFLVDSRSTRPLPHFQAQVRRCTRWVSQLLGILLSCILLILHCSCRYCSFPRMECGLPSADAIFGSVLVKKSAKFTLLSHGARPEKRRFA